MSFVSFQVLDGMERGRVFADIETPFTIGREEDNAVQLNDERVSRFHLKVQEDAGQVILTDLESTNGTRVNGVPTTLRILQIGDLIAIGRCLLVFGDASQIAARFKAEGSSPLQQLQSALSGSDSSAEFDAGVTGATHDPASAHPSDWNDMVDAAAQRLAASPPSPPDTFRLAQRAQLADLVSFIHQRLSVFLQSGLEKEPNDRGGQRVVDGPSWQQLIELEMFLGQTIRQVSDPDQE